MPALSDLGRGGLEVTAREAERVLALRRGDGPSAVYIILHFGDRPAATSLPVAPGRWRKRLDSAEPRWLGPGTRLPETLESAGDVSLTLAPRSVAVYARGEG